MPQLTLINGAPGTGKTTLARKYAARHPLSLVLDIDTIRGCLGAWRDHAMEAGFLARRLALGMASTALQDGHDVLVPQFLGRIDFVLQLADLAADCDVPFVEIALTAPLGTATNRFVRRLELHEDGVEVVEAPDDPSSLVANASVAVSAIVGRRPGTLLIPNGDEDGPAAYAALASAMGAPTLR